MFPRSLVAVGMGLLSFALLSSPAEAWGPEGHAIVADIAEAHLTPSAKAQVSMLLASEGHSHLDEVSSWADAIRSQHRETGPWHYVDIPLEAPGYYVPDRDCKEGQCVVAKIVEFEKVLATKDSPPQQRLDALKWLVHLVGDIHQPLHAADHDDKGGNTVRLSFYGNETNLHAIWDGGIIEEALGWHLGPNYTFDHDAVRAFAERLVTEKLTPRVPFNPSAPPLHGGMDFDPVRGPIAYKVPLWANQSHAFAVTIAYGLLPPVRAGDWSETYQDKAWPAVKTQLFMGGMRLADVLNEALH